MNGLYRRAAFYVLLVLIWEAVSKSGLWPDYLFPSPFEVARRIQEGLRDTSLLWALLASVQRILIGYTLSVLAGIPVGILVGRFKFLDETVGSLMAGLQALPSICWLPVAILWFGLSEAAIQFVVVMGALLSIAIATDNGIKNVPPLYIRAAQTMGVSGFKLYWRVILPASLPSVLTGMKLGWAFAWRALMAGELLFVSVGLGHLLQMGRELLDMPLVLSVMLVISGVGVFFDQLIFSPIERRVRLRWGLTSQV